ncbi:hypothetical protein CRUP_033740 [Coryphaenoides rupestris]|nr:hypothetical protein CRUP_033740 [Coryphaenoides rupestris]
MNCLLRIKPCYYLGASSDAATRITASVARPLASHVPVDKICQRLSSTDKQICELKYEQQLWDLSSGGLLRLRVAQLKRVLACLGRGVPRLPGEARVCVSDPGKGPAPGPPPRGPVTEERPPGFIIIIIKTRLC